jgi:hypothetical protein
MKMLVEVRSLSERESVVEQLIQLDCVDKTMWVPDDLPAGIAVDLSNKEYNHLELDGNIGEQLRLRGFEFVSAAVAVERMKLKVIAGMIEDLSPVKRRELIEKYR